MQRQHSWIEKQTPRFSRRRGLVSIKTALPLAGTAAAVCSPFPLIFFCWVLSQITPPLLPPSPFSPHPNPFHPFLSFLHKSKVQVRRLRRLCFVFPAGQEDLGCEVNGITYQEGQSFQPSCDTYCHCRGGGVICVPACPLDARLPSPDCPNPQHVRLPGKCCKEWVCENLENTVIQDAITGKLDRWMDEAFKSNTVKLLREESLWVGFSPNNEQPPEVTKRSFNMSNIL